MENRRSVILDFFALATVVYRFRFDLSDFFGKIMVWGFWAKMCWK